MGPRVGDPRYHSGRNADPAFRHERAKKGAYASQDVRSYARRIVNRWPKLDQATRDDVRDILRPAVNRAAARKVADPDGEAA